MSRLAYVLMMMWIAGLALGLPGGMVTHGSKAGAKGVRVIDANDNSVDTQNAKNGTVAAKYYYIGGDDADKGYWIGGADDVDLAKDCYCGTIKGTGGTIYDFDCFCTGIGNCGCYGGKKCCGGYDQTEYYCKCCDC